MEEGWKEGKEGEKEKRRKEGGSKRKALSYWSWLGSGEGHGKWVFIKEATLIQTLLGEKPNL